MIGHFRTRTPKGDGNQTRFGTIDGDTATFQNTNPERGRKHAIGTAV